jgi:hypothetical protein
LSRQGAERAVLISALIVFGIYFYRHLSEGTSATSTSSKCNVPQPNGSVSKVGQFLGFGTPANIGQFVTAWGFVFFALSVVSQAAPGFGGMFAILVVTGDVLGNSCQLFHDVSAKVGNQATKGVTGTSTAPSATQGGQPVIGTVG